MSGAFKTAWRYGIIYSVLRQPSPSQLQPHIARVGEKSARFELLFHLDSGFAPASG